MGNERVATDTSIAIAAPVPLTKAPKLLAHEVNLPTLFNFAIRSASIQDAPVAEDLQKLLDGEAKRQQAICENREKKQKRLDKERAKAGFQVVDNDLDSKDEEQARVRLYTEECEAVVGIRSENSWVRGNGSSLRHGKTTHAQDQLLVQGLVDLIQGEVGDNRKFPLDQKFCLKRHSDVSGQSVDRSAVVIDDRYQDIGLFGYPDESPNLVAARAIMDYWSCPLSSEGCEVDSLIKAIESSLSSRYPDQPFSTEVKLYLINRPVDPRELGEPVRNLSEIVYGNRHTFRRSALQGSWTSLRIGMTLNIYATTAKLYRTPSQSSMITYRRAILQHLYPRQIPARQSRDSQVIDLEQFYNQLLQPPALSTRLLDSLQPPGMTTPLLPFQKRSVAWLVQRENADDFDRIAGYQSETWEKLVLGIDAESVPVVYSRLTGKVLPIAYFPEWESDGRESNSEELEGFASEKDEFDLRNVRGSMLCEEMGEFGFSNMYIECLQLTIDVVN